MRKGYLTPSVLIVLALITLFVAAAIFFNAFLLKGLKKEPTPSPSTPIQLSPSASPVPNGVWANWKTYQDAFFGFRIKYPAELQLTQEISEPRKIQNKPIRTKFVAFKSDNGITLYLHLQEDPNFANNDDYLNYLKQTAEDIIKLKEIYIRDVKAVVSTEQVGGMSEKDLIYHSVATFFNDGKTYSVTVDSSQNQEKVLTQILSTFKFVE